MQQTFKNHAIKIEFTFAKVLTLSLRIQINIYIFRLMRNFTTKNHSIMVFGESFDKKMGQKQMNVFDPMSLVRFLTSL